MMLLASAIIATVLGGCPKPVHHIHHKPDAPLCSCTAEPRVIMLPAPTPDPEPIEINVHRYFVLIGDNDLVEFETFDWRPEEIIDIPLGVGYAPKVVQVKAPEIDPASGIAGLTLLAGGLLVLRGGKRGIAE